MDKMWTLNGRYVDGWSERQIWVKDAWWWCRWRLWLAPHYQNTINEHTVTISNVHENTHVVVLGIYKKEWFVAFGGGVALEVGNAGDWLVSTTSISKILSSIAHGACMTAVTHTAHSWYQSFAYFPHSAGYRRVRHHMDGPLVGNKFSSKYLKPEHHQQTNISRDDRKQHIECLQCRRLKDYQHSMPMRTGTFQYSNSNSLVLHDDSPR